MYIKIRVQAGMKAESVRHKKPDHLEIDVKEKAERNMANKRVLELVEYHFKVPKGSVRLISGHHSPSKIVSLPDRSSI